MFGIFDAIEDAVSTSLDVVGGLFEGELPSKSQVVTLVSSGISIAAIAETTGYAQSVIEQIIED